MILTVEVASFEEIDLTVIEKFLQDLPERALNLGIRIVMALIFFFIGIQCIKFLRRIIKKSLEKRKMYIFQRFF